MGRQEVRYRQVDVGLHGGGVLTVRRYEDEVWIDVCLDWRGDGCKRSVFPRGSAGFDDLLWAFQFHPASTREVT